MIFGYQNNKRSEFIKVTFGSNFMHDNVIYQLKVNSVLHKSSLTILYYLYIIQNDFRLSK